MGILLLIFCLIIIAFAFGSEPSNQRGQVKHIQVQCPHCDHTFLHKVNGNSKKSSCRTGAIAGGALGMGGGSNIGIAGSFGGVNGAIPVAIVFAALGALIGYFFASQPNNEFQCPNCGNLLKL